MQLQLVAGLMRSRINPGRAIAKAVHVGLVGLCTGATFGLVPGKGLQLPSLLLSKCRQDEVVVQLQSTGTTSSLTA